MRAKVLNLKEFKIDKYKLKPKVKVLLIPHYAYT